MIIHYGNGIRHRIKLQDGQVKSQLQIRTFLFFWTDVYNGKIDFELRDDPEPCPEGSPARTHINPTVLSWRSQNGYGKTEIWDKSTFDLKVRLYEIADQYAKIVQAAKHYNTELEKQFDQIIH